MPRTMLNPPCASDSASAQWQTAVEPGLRRGSGTAGFAGCRGPGHNVAPACRL